MHNEKERELNYTAYILNRLNGVLKASFNLYHSIMEKTDFI